jgi:phage major head subunit gpT-like protein
MSDAAITPRITSRFVRGELDMQLTGQAQMAWVDRVSRLIDSDQAVEEYAWLGSTPQMREWIGGRNHAKLRENSYQIANKLFEASIDVPLEWVRRDKLGQVQQRIGDLAGRNASHWRSLLTNAINVGHSTVCYDGQYFFDTDHAEGDASAQDNDLTSNIGTASAPTVAEFEASVITMLQTMVGYKDDRNEPMNEAIAGLLLMVPVNMVGAANGAVKSQVITDGSGSRSGQLVGFSDNFRFEVAPNPRLTANDVFFGFALGLNDGLIRQEEYDATPTSKAEGSDYEHDKNAWQFGIKASRNVGYGFWQRACRMAFT